MNGTKLKNNRQIAGRFTNAIMVILVSITIILLVLVLGVGLYQKNHESRIMPGVSVAGIDLSGLSIEEASYRINEIVNYPLNGKITFTYGEQVWDALPIELGLMVNTPQTILNAYEIGRNHGLINNLFSQVIAYLEGLDLPVVLTYDERVTSGFLGNIANQIDNPVLEAELYLDGVQVHSSNGQIGRMLNIDKTLTDVTVALNALQSVVIPLTVEQVQPSVLNVDSTAQTLRNLLNSPLLLALPEQANNDPGPWSIEPATLANLIKIEKNYSDQTAQYQLGIYDSLFIPLLAEISKSIERNSQNARFIFNDDTRQLDLIQNAVVGRKLNIDETIKNIREGIAQGSNEVKLALDTESPQIGDNATAAELGITELVSNVSTYFWGSTDERIQNIQTASSRFHGVLVAPGETFSMSNILGDISLENGYAEALIIYDNRTIAGVGGGVCQVSTTLFRTVFLGGYPVVERHPHAYRVGYYEQTYSGAKDSKWAGLDATVYVPLVDFKFTNDSQYWLLMETYVNIQARSLTWKFYSTNDGRSVQWSSTGLQNIKPAPDPLFQENPELGTNEIKQVDWAADGATITVNRTVLKNDQIYFEDKYVTSYEPWQAICQYGSGVTDPEEKAKAKGLCQ